MMYKALIFDLDGTLTDSLKDLWLSVNHSLRTMGWPERTSDEVRTFVGNGVHLLIERSVPQGTRPEELEQCFQLFRSHYVEHCMDHTAPYPGIPEMLSELNKDGYRMAIVSNKLQAGVNMMYNRHYASLVHVAIGEHDGVCRKPAPDMIFEALTQLKVKKEECIYLGDSDIDIRTAQAAGLPCISVLWGFRDKKFLLAHGATTLAEHPSDILDIIRRNQPLPILYPDNPKN
ncbi:MAG: HAD family hydrolase [Bacteroidaceae bacterium]